MRLGKRQKPWRSSRLLTTFLVKGLGILAATLLCVREDLHPDPEAVFGELFGQSSHCVWLDSSNAASDARANRSRYSIMADDGGSHGRRARHLRGMTVMESELLSLRVPGPFFAWLDRNWHRNRQLVTELPEGLGFALGWLGYLGYELKRECGGSSVNSLLPDASLILACRAVVFDHRERCVYVMALAGEEGERWSADTVRRLRKAPSDASQPAGLLPAVSFQPSESSNSYIEKIVSSQKEIADGNSYKVCLTAQISSSSHERVDPWLFYRHLRKASPAPFASLVRLGTVAVGSSSPERFLGISPTVDICAELIKGTRPRSSEREEDNQLRRQLHDSEKDRAENIMIVDLLRNDLSRKALPGSVAVTRLCAVESYATVHQMVSTIVARIGEGHSRSEVVAAAYPP
jgi:anthranilate synthase component 1/para-aminobenzoate synthetase